jgi:hypothetical protein
VHRNFWWWEQDRIRLGAGGGCRIQGVTSGTVSVEGGRRRPVPGTDSGVGQGGMAGPEECESGAGSLQGGLRLDRTGHCGCCTGECYCLQNTKGGEQC